MTLAWGVVRVNDDGRAELVRRDLSAATAEKVAGELRDASSESEIEAGWNYLPKCLARAQRPGRSKERWA